MGLYRFSDRVFRMAIGACVSDSVWCEVVIGSDCYIGSQRETMCSDLANKRDLCKEFVANPEFLHSKINHAVIGLLTLVWHGAGNWTNKFFCSLNIGPFLKLFNAPPFLWPEKQISLQKKEP